MNRQSQRLSRRSLALAAAAVAPFGAVAFSAGGPESPSARAAHQATPPPQADLLAHLDTPMVFVTGAGSLRVPPDIATVAVGVDVERLTLAEAQTEATVGANEVQDIWFALTDPAAPACRSRAAAMADARAKADELAAAGGTAISHVVSISETFFPPPVRAFATGSGADATVPISIGTEEVSVEVQVAYALA
jgi:uncharacterized protein YggE